MTRALTSMRRPRFGRLWNEQSFRRLWLGETVSALGSEIGSIAMVLVAAVVVGVTPIEMGAIFIAGVGPSAVLGLFAGVWVDRLRRRPLIVAVNLGRAIVVLLLAALVLSGRIELGILLLASFLLGLLEAIAEPAYEAFLPTVVGRDRLVEANARLGLGVSGAGIIGPGIGGVLLQLLSAPIVLVIDAVSFVFAALAVGSIDVPADRGREPSAERHLTGELREGLQQLRKDQRLLTIALAGAALVFVGAFTFTNWVLYIVSLVGDQAALVLGVLFTAGSAGFLVGAAVAPAVGRRIGMGGAIISGALLVTVSPFFMPIAPAGNPPLATALLAAAAVVGALGSVIGNVHTASVVQAVTPDALLGRVSSATGTLRNSALVAGTIIGGLVGTYIGLREAIWLSALGHLVPLAIVAASPLRRLTTLPASLTSTPT